MEGAGEGDTFLVSAATIANPVWLMSDKAKTVTMSRVAQAYMLILSRNVDSTFLPPAGVSSCSPYCYREILQNRRETLINTAMLGSSGKGPKKGNWDKFPFTLWYISPKLLVATLCVNDLFRCLYLK